MIYVGVAAHLLDIDVEEVRKALFKQFGEKKRKAAEMNWQAVLAGQKVRHREPHEGRSVEVERMDATGGRLIIDGNTAAALAASLPE